MRKLMLVAGCLTALCASADALVYESFEQAEAGALDKVSGGIGFAQSWTAEGVVKVNRGNLSYSSGDISINGGNCYLTFGPSTSKANVFSRQLSSAAFPDDGSDIYMSFLVRVPASATAEDDKDYFMIALADGATSTPVFGPLYRQLSSGSGNGFGLRHNGSNIPGSEAVEADTVHLVVAKLSKDGQSYYRYMSLIVDPSTSAEPAIELWNITNQYQNVKTALSKYSYIQCYVKYDSKDTEKCETDDVFAIDEFRMGTTWADVVGTATYGGLVPTPYFEVTGDESSRTIAVLNNLSGNNIYYTIDGSTPSAQNGTKYEVPFDIARYTVVKAVAVNKDGNTSSCVSTVITFESHWVGEGEDQNWSTPENWSPAGSCQNRSIVFGAQCRTTSSVVNSIVSQDETVSSLCFTNNSFSPAMAAKDTYWHVIKIPDGTTLTVNGMSSDGNVLRMWSPMTSGEPNMGAKFTGGGKLHIDSPDADVITVFKSSNNKAYAQLLFAGLSEFNCTVSTFTLCYGKRSRGLMMLAKEGAGRNTLTMDAFYLGDLHSEDQGGSDVQLQLGKENVIHADRFYIGAPPPGYIHANGATLKFQSGMTDPTVTIRAKDGVGRADMQVGSHGNAVATPRGMSATADFTGGTVDALVGNLVVGNGRGYHWSNAYGNLSGTLNMNAGVIDAVSAVIGRSEYTSGSRNTDAKPAAGTVTISGGEFTIQENCQLGFNSTGAEQSVSGSLNLNGGSVSIGGDLLMATRNGLATNIVSTLSVTDGCIHVNGNLASGSDNTDFTSASLPGVAANVNALGGVIAVTNELGTSELRLERGTLNIAGGQVYADNLVLTNEASVLAVSIGGTPIKAAEVSGAVKLGGTFRATVEDGVFIRPGASWTIVKGAAERTGAFAATDLPDGYKVRCTDDGVVLEYPSQGLKVIVR